MLSNQNLSCKPLSLSIIYIYRTIIYIYGDGNASMLSNQNLSGKGLSIIYIYCTSLYTYMETIIHIYGDGNASTDVQSKHLRQGPVNYLRNLNLADTSVLQV